MGNAMKTEPPGGGSNLLPPSDKRGSDPVRDHVAAFIVHHAATLGPEGIALVALIESHAVEGRVRLSYSEIARIYGWAKTTAITWMQRLQDLDILSVVPGDRTTPNEWVLSDGGSKLLPPIPPKLVRRWYQNFEGGSPALPPKDHLPPVDTRARTRSDPSHDHDQKKIMIDRSIDDRSTSIFQLYGSITGNPIKECDYHFVSTLHDVDLEAVRVGIQRTQANAAKSEIEIGSLAYCAKEIRKAAKQRAHSRVGAHAGDVVQLQPELAEDEPETLAVGRPFPSGSNAQGSRAGAPAMTYGAAALKLVPPTGDVEAQKQRIREAAVLILRDAAGEISREQLRVQLAVWCASADVDARLVDACYPAPRPPRAEPDVPEPPPLAPPAEEVSLDAAAAEDPRLEELRRTASSLLAETPAAKRSGFRAITSIAECPTDDTNSSE